MLTIEKLKFAYPNQAWLFEDLQLGLLSGKIYGLLGKNGAGKTTLLKILCGLLFPQQGECDVLGYQPQDRFSKFLENIYLIPEEFYVPSITAIEYEKLYSPFYRQFDHENFTHCLKEFDLPENQKLSHLSYGQKKKFLIAFGISTNCKLFILDEPTNGLDIPSKSQFRKLVASAITDEQTFIISTHQVRDVENLIDSVIVLDQGKVIFDHSLQEVSQHLLFDIRSDMPTLSSALYWEKTFNGYRTVGFGQADYESQVDLEMLFNAVITNPNGMQKILKGEGK